MKNKKIIPVLIFFLILPYPLFITPNLKDRTLKNSAFNNIKLPESSASEITITYPENKTYYNAMDGYFPATYGFESGTEGDTSYNDWYFSAGYGYDRPTIWDELEGHKKVVGMNDIRTDDRSEATHNFGSQSSGTVELWIFGNNTNKLFYITLRQNLDPEFYNGAYIKIFSGNLYYYKGVTDFLITSFENNTWYHLRIDFECGHEGYQNLGLQKYKLQLTPEGNSTQYYGPYNLDWPLDYVNEVCISTSYPQAGAEYYFDAFAYSWDPLYDIGDNKVPGLFICFNESITMDELCYSLNGQNVSIYGNHTIRMPADGTHGIQIFGNSSGQPYHSDVRYFTVNLNEPGELILNTNAHEPDLDGIFNLTWTQIGVANNYTLYEYNETITEINNNLTIIAINITNNTYSIIHPKDDALFYKIVAFNRYGNSSSNCRAINVQVTPLLYNDFQINYISDNHFQDIILTWTSSPNADNYSIYKSNNSITEFNKNLTLVESGLENNSIHLTELEEGIFFYILVAYNEFGNISSNCASIRIEFPSAEEPHENDDTLIIFLMLTFIVLASVIAFITLVGLGFIKRMKRNLRQTEGVIIRLKDLGKKKDAITKKDISFFKEKHYCLIHKGPITGYTFVCPHCGTYYCTNCKNALEDLDNICWACNKSLIQFKPTKKDLPTKSDKSSAPKKYQDPNKLTPI